MSNEQLPVEPSAVPPVVNWKAITWRKLQHHVRRIQQRIFRAEQQGNKRKVRSLQRLLMRSRAALLLSIRQVTQINKGKRTAGIDRYKALNQEQRTKLYQEMCTLNLEEHSPPPVRRVYIEKEGKPGKLRPLSIPTIRDRVVQNLAKLALEPQWEVRFEPISYGFRPKRSAHDALEAINKKLTKREWIFEGDFRGCFDHLNHDYILEQTKGFPGHRLIRKWLKAGYVDDNVFHRTEEGTQQGSLLSPVLANIALHGMEEAIGVKYKQYKTYSKDSNGKKGAPELRHMVKPDSVTIVRYADDFVILCHTKEEAESMYGKLAPYLEKRGLTLATEKTKITSIFDGFDFLGHNFRRFEPGNHKGSYYSNPPLVIKPSNKSIKKARRKIAETFKRCIGNNVGTLIHSLNPIIRGTVNYWRHATSRDTKGAETKHALSALDYYVWIKTRKFLCRLHPNKSWKWIIGKYFKPDHTGQSTNRWILTDPDNHNFQTIKASWTSIEYHFMIRYTSSPFDPSLKEYFEMRDQIEFNSMNIGRRQKLAKKQNYKCPLCGMSIIDKNEGLEVHRKIPTCQGGNNAMNNLELVHISCHIDHHAKHPVRSTSPSQPLLQKDRAKRKYQRSKETWTKKTTESGLD